ncbi:MAG: 4Fe-4S dicluster domain-containing protein [Chloroflexales bacterium]
MTIDRRSLLFDLTRAEVLATGHVLPEPARCVQCGICSYNCPIGLDVRAYAWRGEAISDSHCLTCGQCVARCPRGVLIFAPMANGKS